MVSPGNANSLNLVELYLFQSLQVPTQFRLDSRAGTDPALNQLLNPEYSLRWIQSALIALDMRLKVLEANIVHAFIMRSSKTETEKVEEVRGIMRECMESAFEEIFRKYAFQSEAHYF